jgi:hypothetical protein
MECVGYKHSAPPELGRNGVRRLQTFSSSGAGGRGESETLLGEAESPEVSKLEAPGFEPVVNDWNI